MFFVCLLWKIQTVENGLKWTNVQLVQMDIFAINNGRKCCRTAFHNGSVKP